jgi:hypothetical protein
VNNFQSCITFDILDFLIRGAHPSPHSNASMQAPLIGGHGGMMADNSKNKKVSEKKKKSFLSLTLCGCTLDVHL